MKRSPNMRRKTAFAGLALSAVFFVSPLIANAYGYDWDIPTFESDITVEKDSTLLIRETRLIDYSREAHHGPIISIPLKYRDRFNQSFNLRFTLLNVEDENGTPWNHETYQEGDYMNIKIGSADVLVDRTATYVTTYKMQRAVSFHFDDHDELYWNVTGDESPVSIGRATANVHLPAGITADQIRAVCYTGGYGSTAQDCTYETTENGASFSTTRELMPMEGLTIAVSFPKGVVQTPDAAQQIGWYLADNFGYLLPVLTLMVMGYLWYSRGRDPKTNRDTVMPWYKPPENMTPAEAGALIDESVDMRDISSTIISLAVRGYLKIVENKEKKMVFDKTGYSFEKLADTIKGETLKPHEEKTLQAIFNGGNKRELSDLENKFYSDLPDIREGIYESLVKQGYFPKSPDKIRNSYLTSGIALIFIPIFFGIFIEALPISVPIGIALSGVVILVFARFMPAKTRKGVEEYYKILGLEEFIRTAERDRIKFQEEENIFEKILPYAMAFGIGEKWAKAFEGIQKTPPEWYQSNDPNYMNNFSTYYFLNRLDSLSNNMNSTFTSAPRSSGSGGAWSGGSGFGGGFSGGGFGGGGTSSW